MSFNLRFPAVAELKAATTVMARRLTGSPMSVFSEPDPPKADSVQCHVAPRTALVPSRFLADANWNPAAATASLEAWQGRLELGVLRKFGVAEQLFAASSGHSFIVTRGVVGMFCSMCSGGHLYALCYPGHVVEGSRGADADSVWATSITEVTGYRLTIEQLRLAGERDIVVRELTKRSVWVQLQRRTKALAELLTLCPAARLERLLLELTRVVRAHGDRSESLDLVAPLRDEQLAMLLGLSLRQFHRLKKRLKQEGHLVVDDRGRIRLGREHLCVQP